MSVEYSPECSVPYHFVCYDARGQERRGAQGMASAELLKAAQSQQPTDVFLFAHGWNADPRAALDQYGRWIDTMAASAPERHRLTARAEGFRPFLVGLHWPSKAWADEELTTISYTAEDEPVPTSQHDLVAEYAERLGDGPGTKSAIRTIVESALTDAAPPALPNDVRDAYTRLNANLGLGEAKAGAPPGSDRELFDAEETYQAALLMDVVEPFPFAGFSLGGVLAPLRVLSFWAMKGRARSFGETGAARLLDQLQEAAPLARFHIAGHSFGCIVASAAVAGAPDSGDTRRGVDTLLLVQGAMSLWSFCDDIPARPGFEGYFHRLVRDGLVRGPTMATTSIHDRAIRVFYPLGAGARGDVAFDLGDLPTYGGIGTFGVRGHGVEVEDERLERVTDQYELRPRTVYNLIADSVIATRAGIQGAHSDICHPELARALWCAVARP